MRNLGRKRFLKGLACGLTGIGLRREFPPCRKDDRRQPIMLNVRTFSCVRVYGGFLVPLRETTFYAYDVNEPLAALGGAGDGTELKAVAVYELQDLPTGVDLLSILRDGAVIKLNPDQDYPRQPSAGPLFPLQGVRPAPADAVTISVFDANGNLKVIAGPLDEACLQDVPAVTNWREIMGGAALPTIVYDAEARLSMEPLPANLVPLTTFTYDDAGSPPAEAGHLS
jgi:hypothetical protein